MKHNIPKGLLTAETLLKIKDAFEIEDRRILRSIGEFCGIKIYVDPKMRPNEWKIVAGVEAYNKMITPLEPYLLTPKKI
jgi:hypothetical protein